MKVNHEIQEEGAFVCRALHHRKDSAVLLHVVFKKQNYEKQYDEHAQLDILMAPVVAFVPYLFERIPQ